MLIERLCFTILMFLVNTPPGTPPPVAEETRKKKCPGCQRTHDNHTFGLPGRNCQGPSPSSSPTAASRAGRNTEQHKQKTPDSRENPDACLSSTEQIEQYRRHLKFLKNQENELLESIRKDQEIRFVKRML